MPNNMRLKMYDKKSLKAEEFINHEEVLRTLDYAEKNKNNLELINEILEKPARQELEEKLSVKA